MAGHFFWDGPARPEPAPNGWYTMMVNTNGYYLQPAITETEQAKGLGGRIGMPIDQGMIFVFPGDEQRCFWMKDMHFSLDMIWVDSAKKVTHIEQNVSPSTYPRAYCFNGKYVIELNAGEAARARIHTNQTLAF